MAESSVIDSSDENTRKRATPVRDENGSSTNGAHERSGSYSGSPRGAEHESRGGYNRDRDSRGQSNDRAKLGAMEVSVDHNIEKAMKILKRKLIKEGLFKELKSRRYYEKPSERKKRKTKESQKKIRKEEARNKKNLTMLM